MLAIIALSFWSVIRNRIGEKKWLLRAALYGIPLPWIAVEAGWFVAEYGRQPWAIGEVLPTAVANSSLTAGELIFSMVLILPWIAVEAGWFVAEYGRQPWAIGEVLPTAVANSSLTAGELIFSMVLICGLYTLFLVAELFLMFKFARLGPSSLKTGRYHFEQSSTTLTAGDLIFSMVLICGLYTLFLVAELFLMFKFARLGPSSLKTGRYHFDHSSSTTQPAR